MACVQVDLQTDSGGLKRHEDAVDFTIEFQGVVARVQSRCAGRTGRQVLKVLQSTPTIPGGVRAIPATIPVDRHFTHADIAKSIRDFDFSCRAFADGLALTFGDRAYGCW